MKRHITAGLCLFVLIIVIKPTSADEMRIGVLAFRGTLTAVNRWQPTADYLSAKIPAHHFQIVPLALEQLRAATSQGSIDFIITNTGEYVDLEVQYGISRIATLQNVIDGKINTTFGAVIFVRADRSDIKTLKDLKGKSLMGVNETGFGGFRMAWRELLAQDVDPYNDLSKLSFSGFPQGNVATAVLNGVVDAGTFRTGSLERMQQQGKIDLSELRVLNPKQVAGFPLLVSTRMYPSWPIAKLKHVKPDLAKRVAGELFSLDPESKAARAAHIYGWTIPLNYQAVHELLMILKVGPYASLNEISFWGLLKRYWIGGSIFLIGFVAMLLLIARLVKENRWRKRIQYELKHHQEHLLELVHERTRDIVLMRDQAISANEVKNVFLSTMSHELRTPLNAIIGYCELLLEEQRFQYINQEERELEKIHVSALHLLRIIDKILNVSRIEDGSAKLQVELFSLEDLIEDTVSAISSMAMENNNLLIVQNNCPYETIQTDMLRLQEAIVHILENACKFTKHGRIEYLINADQVKGIDWIEFTVQDNGIGMNQEQQTDIFEIFTQADSDYNRKFAGIGVGLALSRSYCRIMGGDIKFTSVQGEGSQFTIRIPTVICQPKHQTGAA